MSDIDTITTLAQPIVKREWQRVKRGASSALRRRNALFRYSGLQPAFGS